VILGDDRAGKDDGAGDAKDNEDEKQIEIKKEGVELSKNIEKETA